jgi:hypothetical protein
MSTFRKPHEEQKNTYGRENNEKQHRNNFMKDEGICFVPVNDVTYYIIKITSI